MDLINLIRVSALSMIFAIPSNDHIQHAISRENSTGVISLYQVDFLLTEHFKACMIIFGLL